MGSTSVDSNINWSILSEGGGWQGRFAPSLGQCDETGSSEGWNVRLVARAWDPRNRPSTEFRCIRWKGKLNCLSQYFHPLHFPELVDQKADIERDIVACVEGRDVQAAIVKLDGCCIVDFTRFGPGEVMIVELNSFDGLALGAFPASTGLFLWDDPYDHRVVSGEAFFEFRTREEPMEERKFKADFNQAWRAIVHEN